MHTCVVHIPIYAVQGMSEPRGRLAQCSVSLHAVLAASLGAHSKAQHARAGDIFSQGLFVGNRWRSAGKRNLEG